MKENKELKRTIERMTKEFNENKKIEEANAQMLLLEKNTKLAIQEKKEIEEALCSGTLSIDELTEKSKRLPEIKDALEEKEMRWLELSEIDG